METKRIPPRPWLSKGVARLLKPINALFDYLYHSEFNPFYRSGTLAIGMLFVLLATGTYLLFFYSVSAPYASMQVIQEQVWLGRWIRSLHRYATDAALIAVFFHVVQLLSHGKTWGPRTLAWCSGVFLLTALYISAWTGYVMVWDTHAQYLALAGLSLLEAIPFMSSNLGRAFSGESPIPASFFFMNLFLHVAIPLGMFLGMWIHTAKLARTVWLPHPAIFYSSLIALTILSIAIPCALLPEANLLTMIGQLRYDWWFGFWIPLIEKSSAGFVLTCFFSLFLLGLTIPWWWRPSKNSIPSISEVDADTCTGCTQCARDCPYEAISMKPHPNGKHLLAEVSAHHCVSCGICTASCDVLAVGPAGRSGKDQDLAVDEFVAAIPIEDKDTAITVVACRHNDSVPEFLAQFAKDKPTLHYYDINCCGTLLSSSAEKLLSRTGGIVLSGCAARNCMNRDGLNLLLGRLFGKRVPFLDRTIDKKRIVVAPHSESETGELVQEIAALEKYLQARSSAENDGNKSLSSATRVSWFIKRTLASIVLLAIVAVLNQAKVGEAAQLAQLRIAGRVPSRISHSCRPPTEAENAQTPAHMRKLEICQQETLTYLLLVKVDGAEIYRETLKPRSERDNLPTILNHELALEPGEHKLQITLSPTASQRVQELSQEHDLSLSAGEVFLVSLTPEQQ